MIRKTLVSLAFVLTALVGVAQDVVTYKMPPEEIAKLADAAPTPGASLNPTRETLALLQAPAYPDITDLAQSELKLAGLRFNPANLDQSRATYFVTMRLVDLASGKESAVTGLPAGAATHARHCHPSRILLSRG